MNLRFSVFLLIVLFISKIQAQDVTSVIMDKAYKEAKAENKHVFVKFGASWCKWCKKMDKQMKSEPCADLFESNYVMVNLVVKESKGKEDLETPGAESFLATYKGDQAGLPFWLIFDSSGHLLGDSFNAKGENLGCPAIKEEVDLFIALLKKSSKLTDENLDIITETFLSTN